MREIINYLQILSALYIGYVGCNHTVAVFKTINLLTIFYRPIRNVCCIHTKNCILSSQFVMTMSLKAE
jgi:hypothetical protein